jgi:hypothetical protein
MNRSTDVISAIRIALAGEGIGLGCESGVGGIFRIALGDKVSDHLSSKLRKLLVTSAMEVSKLAVIKTKQV